MLRLMLIRLKCGSCTIKTKPNTPFRLLDLPTELIVLILSNIPFPALLFYRTTCRVFNTLITTSSPIQYAIALQFHGFSDNTNYVLSCADRVRRLTACEEAWRTFSPKFKNIPLRRDHRVSWINHLADGVFFLGDAGMSRATNESAMKPATALQTLVLPAESYHGRHGYWNRINFVGRDVLNVGSAIQAHDLIAIVTAKPDTQISNIAVIQAHLLQFSTGKAHPGTTRHRFTITVTLPSEGARLPKVSVDILGSYLAVLLAYLPPVADALDKFFLFDWKTGAVILSWRFPSGTHHSFIFLTAQILLFPNFATGALDIFHIPAHALLTNEPHRPCPACSFILPTLKHSFRYRYIHARAEPKPDAPVSTDYCFLDERPFRASPAHTVLRFHVAVQSTMGHMAWGMHGMRNYTLLIHRESLLAHVPPFPGESLPSPLSLPHAAAVLPWKSWGPPVTRWLEAQGMGRWLLGASAGQRHVRLAPDKRLHVLDFNPWHVRRVVGLSQQGRFACQGQRNGEKVSVVKGRTTLQSGGEPSPWKDKVYSSLPYVLTVSEWHFEYSKVVMDEQRLVGFGKANADGQLKLQELHFG